MIINEGSGQSLPNLTNPAIAADLVANKQLIDQNGNIMTGTMPIVIQPAPTISVEANGLITATHNQESGKVMGGTEQATHQLTTQSGTTITPGTSQKTAVPSGRYTTGNVYIAGDANLKASNIKSGVSMFGVMGTYGGTIIQTKTGTYNSTNSKYSNFEISIDSGAKGLVGVTVTSHGIFTQIDIANLSSISGSFVTFMQGYASSEPVSILDMDGFISWNAGSGRIGYGLIGAPSVPTAKLRVGIRDRNGQKVVDFNYGFDGSSSSVYYAGGTVETYGIDYTIIYAV